MDGEMVTGPMCGGRSGMRALVCRRHTRRTHHPLRIRSCSLPFPFEFDFPGYWMTTLPAPYVVDVAGGWPYADKIAKAPRRQ